MDIEARDNRKMGIFKPICDSCKEEIYLCEEYVDIDGVYYHVDCLRELGIREVLTLCGVDILERWEDEFEEGY